LILRFLRRRVASEDVARDICQEILLTVHRARHTYEPSRPFEPWLYSIARSRLIDHLRRARRVTFFEIATDQLPEVAGGLDAPMDASVEEALAALPPAQREAFLMLKIEGLSTKEAAERAGVGVSALKVRAHRAYVSLRRALGAGGSDEST
jgi:RNA polymerase sigma-70 factor (ECF subfamily)